MTRAMPAAAQPLPTPQKAWRSKVFLAVVPDVGEEPGLLVPEDPPQALDLLHGLGRGPGHGQKGRGHVHRIDPDLGLVVDMMERSIGRLRRLLQEVFEHAVGAVLEQRVAGRLGRKENAFAVGGRVGDAVIVGDHPQAPIFINAQHRPAGHADDHVAVAPFEEGLHGHALLPGFPLHGQHGHLDLFDEGPGIRPRSRRGGRLGAERRERSRGRPGGNDLLQRLSSLHGSSPVRSWPPPAGRAGGGIVVQAPGARQHAVWRRPLPAGLAS